MIKSKPKCLPMRHPSFAVYFVLIYQFALTVPNYAQTSGLVAFNGDTQVGSCLAASPDGKYIYSGGANTIAVFSRQPDGTLITKYVLNNYHDAIEELTYIVDMAVSPDGRHLYAANLDLDKHSILTFERDLSTGAITLIDTRDFPTIDIYSFDSGHKLFLSPDGKKLYWFFRDQRTYASGAFMLFARDAVTGRLTVLQTLQDNDSQLGGFKIPPALAVTPDGKHLYGVGRNDEWLLIFAHDSATGLMYLADTVKTDLQLRSYTLGGSVAISPNGSFLYAAFRYSNGQGKLYVFKRNSDHGDLALVNSAVPEIPNFVHVSPDGSHLYATAGSRVFSYSIDSSNGAIKLVDKFDCQCSAAAYSFAFPPDGETIYLSFGEGVIALDREVQSGMLATRQILGSNDLGGTDRLYGGRAVEVLPNGAHLYVGTDADAAISTFARDQARGRLALVEADSVGRVSAMKISPQGEHLYATTQKNEIRAFALDAQSGVIDLVQTLTDTVQQYHTLAFSPDGRQLYLADYKRVKVFARDPISGFLRGVQSFTRAGFRDSRVITLAASPEGDNVYWQGNTFSREYRGIQVFVLKRNSVGGKLAFVDSLQLSLPNFDYVLGNRALQISPDGKHVYAGITAVKIVDDGRDNNADMMLALFEREGDNGHLRLVETVRQINWDYWDEFIDLAVSADGREVYALLDFSGVISFGIPILTREEESGKLTQRSFFEIPKVGGYDAPTTDFALSPDGAFIYITDQIGVTTFATGRRITTRVGENTRAAVALPRTLSLEQNHPNPFSSTTHTSQRTTVIHYEIAAANANSQPVELAIYNTQGQLVRMLVNEAQASGKHAATWNGANAQGQLVPSGVYFYRLKMGEQSVTKKLLLVR